MPLPQPRNLTLSLFVYGEGTGEVMELPPSLLGKGARGLGLLQLRQLLLSIGFVERVQEFVQFALENAI